MATYSFTLTDRAGGNPQVVSSVVTEPKGRYRMSRPTAWTITVPTSGSDAVELYGANKTMLQVQRNSSLVANVLQRGPLRVKGNKNLAKATVSFVDPMAWWWFRMLRDATGNYAYPTFSDPITVGQLLFQAITNAIAFDGGGGYGMGISLGSDATTNNVYSALGNFPLKIGELATLLASTGMGEWFINPIAAGPTYGVLDVYERMGSDKSGSVQFVYGDGGNCEDAAYEEDGSHQITALRHLLGRKINEEQWQASIDTTTATNMPDPPQSAISAAVDSMRAQIGFWMDLRVFEDAEIFEGESPVTTARKLARRLWQMEMALRVRPKRLAYATPYPEGGDPVSGPTPFDDYFLGDAVGINLPGLGNVMDGAIVQGDQRVYGFDVMPEEKTLLERSMVITSPDASEIVG